MMEDMTGDMLKQRGFDEMQTNARNIRFFIKLAPDSAYNGAKLCALIQNTNGCVIEKEQMENLLHQIENTMLLRGFRGLELMSIIFTDDVQRDRGMVQTDMPVWLVDTENLALLIYENGPEDYEGLRSPLEQMLQEQEEKNSPKFRVMQMLRGSYMTMLLCLINIVVFLVLEMIGNTEDSTFMALHGADNWRLVFENGEYYRLFTGMFLHFGIEHLASNMLSLFVIGRIVEKMTGSIKFLLIYLVSGLGASFLSCFYYMVHNEMVVSAGASGAIFGIMGALAIIAFKQRNMQGESFGQKLLLLFAFMILDSYITDGVDFIAHLGGLIIGMVLTAVFYRSPKEVV